MKLKLSKTEEIELTEREEKIYYVARKIGDTNGFWRGLLIGAIIFWAIASIGISIIESLSK